MKYIPPFGAVPVNDTDEVARITTPLCDTVSIGSLLAFLIKNKLAALPEIVVNPVLDTVNGL